MVHPPLPHNSYLDNQMTGGLAERRQCDITRIYRIAYLDPDN